MGDIYITTSPENPASRWLGTTWEKIEGRFLLGANEFYPINSVEGNATITLTANHMPKHRHKVDTTSASISAHTHVFQPPLSLCANSYEGEGSYVSGKSSNNQQIGAANTQSAGGGSTGTISPYTDYQGSGESISIMPPYIAVNIWKRLT